MSHRKASSLAPRLASGSAGILGLELAAWMATIFAAAFAQDDYPVFTAYVAGTTFYATLALAPLGFLLGVAAFLCLGDEQGEATRKRAMLGTVLHPVVLGFALYVGMA